MARDVADMCANTRLLKRARSPTHAVCTYETERDRSGKTAVKVAQADMEQQVPLPCLDQSITRLGCKLQRVLEPAWMMGTESSPNALPGDQQQQTGHFRASPAWGGNGSMGQNQPLSPLNANADVGEGTKNVFLARRARETHGECLSLPRRPDGNRAHVIHNTPCSPWGRGPPHCQKETRTWPSARYSSRCAPISSTKTPQTHTTLREKG